MGFLLAALLGMLISILLCLYRSTREAQPSFAIPFCIAFLVGAAEVLMSYGLSLFTWSFWLKPPILIFAPSMPAEVFTMYMAFGFAAFVPALLVVVAYRLMWDD